MTTAEEIYSLSLKGLLASTIQDENVLNKTINNLELYLRRHYSKNGHPAIVLDLEENEFYFVTLNKQDEQ